MLVLLLTCDTTLLLILTSGRRIKAPTEYHPEYAGHRVSAYLYVCVAGAAEQSGPTARLSTPHPSPQTPHLETWAEV
jgi:hypothetical protein